MLLRVKRWHRLIGGLSAWMMLLIGGTLTAAHASADYLCVRLSMPESDVSITMSVKDGIQMPDHRLSAPPPLAYQPEPETLYRKFSPDRKYLAYFYPWPSPGIEFSRSPIDTTLYVENRQTGQSVALRTGRIQWQSKDPMDPRDRISVLLAWSPDGQWLASNWSLLDPSQYDGLTIAHPDGSEIHTVPNAGIGVYSANLALGWSPDSAYILVAAQEYQDGGPMPWPFGIFSVPDLQLITSFSSHYVDFKWSPHGHGFDVLKEDCEVSQFAAPGEAAAQTWTMSGDHNCDSFEWSPDGRYFVTKKDVTTNVENITYTCFVKDTLAPDRNNTLEFSAQGYATFFTPMIGWSADGHTLFFTQNQGSPDAEDAKSGPYNLVALHLPERRFEILVRDVLPGPSIDIYDMTNPLVLRAGNHLAYVVGQAGSVGVELVDLDRSQRVTLVKPNANIHVAYLRWSPNRKVILTVWSETDLYPLRTRWHITSANADGSGLRDIIDDSLVIAHSGDNLVEYDDEGGFMERAFSYLVWLDDGSRIAYQALRDAQPGIEIANLETSTHHHIGDLPDTPGPDHGTFWRAPLLSPDGKYVALALSGDMLYLASTDGAWTRPVHSDFYAEGEGDIYPQWFWAWSPDSSKLAFVYKLPQTTNGVDLAVGVMSASGAMLASFPVDEAKLTYSSSLTWTKCN